jgi:hypothetical protein
VEIHFRHHRVVGTSPYLKVELNHTIRAPLWKGLSTNTWNGDKHVLSDKKFLCSQQLPGRWVIVGASRVIVWVCSALHLAFCIYIGGT